MENLFTKKKIVSSIGWRFAEKTGIQIVNFVVSVVIARVIDPEAYGIVALVGAVVAILEVFVDSGLGNSLIQKKNPDDLDYSSVFVANLMICVVMYTGLFFLAPYIAGIYDSNQMVALIRVSGIGLIVSALKNVQHAYISKNMMFKKFFFASLIGTVVAGIVGVVMAILGYGPWALIVTSLCDAIIDTFIMWISIKWRPSFSFSWDRFIKLFDFGWKILASSLLDSVYGKLHQFIIGLSFSKTDLAYYDKGDALPNKLTNNINSSINSVMRPVLSNSQDDPEAMKILMKKMMSISMYVIAPMLFGLASIAKPLVSIVYTDKWLPIVPYVKIMSITAAFLPVHTTNINAIRAKGRSDIFLKQEIAKKITGITLLLVASRISVMAIAYTIFISDLISFFINSYPNKKLFNYSPLEQIIDVFPFVISSLIMFLVVESLSILPCGVWGLLIIQICTGIIIYLLLSLVFMRKELKYVAEILRDFKRKFKKSRV